MCLKNGMMTERSELTLKNFFIFNNSYGQEEGQEINKVMYYYPPNVDVNTQMKHVGLSEAIIQFTETFSRTEPCESLRTEKTRQLYFQPEAHFWMVMTLNVPTVKCGLEGVEHRGEEVQDAVYHAVLKQAYHMARLFVGPFSSLLDPDLAHPNDRLKQKLHRFYSKYLQSLHPERCDILDVFQGVQFLPLDKVTFLHVQCLINLAEATIPNIQLSAFLFNLQLVWSGLEPEDMQVVFRYLVTSLLPANSRSYASAATSTNNQARFVTGPSNLEDINEVVGKVPCVYLHHVRPEPTTYHLIVYQTGGAVICLFVDGKTELRMELFRRIHVFLGPRLSKLVAELVAYTEGQEAAAASCTSAQGLEGSLATGGRFVYFNRMNLATKSTVHCSPSGSVSVSRHVLRLLADINEQHRRLSTTGCPTAETVVKTVQDYWVIGKLCNAREFYVVIQHKNANLIEINEEVTRICDKQLKSIFFHI